MRYAYVFGPCIGLFFVYTEQPEIGVNGLALGTGRQVVTCTPTTNEVKLVMRPTSL